MLHVETPNLLVSGLFGVVGVAGFLTWHHHLMTDWHADYLGSRIYTGDEICARPCPVPANPGVYGWWFRKIPGNIATGDCKTREHDESTLTLLYTGISPSKPPGNGRPPSKQNIQRRIRANHFGGNAAGSTLRLTLGCLLADELGTELRRVGSGKRMTFHTGETVLTEWMKQNALVSWVVHPEPWELEDELIASLDVPLNLQGNRHNTFHPELSALRVRAKRGAEELPVLPNLRPCAL
ncbi:hypothetical protein DFR67_114149 [Williamsia limnetica]|uniref:GIY-YIG catalytic domain-containing protein n=1 Tax=Williamsia limnetica TaxID=882452 RepID=A0A318RDY7_WILLI|nr:hypothetical protein [Williamsia limnetica]PYE14050.1 hypothetical protein DFR67_114149 [Williamsia limnetica]